MLLVDLSVVHSEGDTLGTETTRSTNSVKINLWVGNLFILELDGWHVVVDNELCLWNIDTSCNHVSSDKSMNLLVTETTNGVVTLFLCHL